MFLTYEQIDRLAESAGRDRLVILFLAYTDVRYGEMAALRGRNLDLLRRRALISDAVADVNGHAVFGTPKTHPRRQGPSRGSSWTSSPRTSPARRPTTFVFSAAKGGVLHLRNFRRMSWNPAVRAAGLDGLTPHALRHTAASLAIASGAERPSRRPPRPAGR